MRHIILALLLSACTSYPKIDWPAGAAFKANPTLLPQADLLSGPVAADPGPALVSRANALRAKAGGLTQ